MATSDNQALILQISADLSQLTKAFKKANGIVDDASNSMVRQAKSGGDALEKEFGNSGTRAGQALAKSLTGETGKAIALNRMQMMELAHVARAVFDGAVAGQNPMRILAMESARVGQALGSGEGGVAGSLAAIGGMAAEFAPVIAAIAALAVVGGAVGLAFAEAAKQADELRKDTSFLEYMGNGAKYSAQAVAGVAEGIRATGVSAKDANSELRNFIQNNIAPDRLEQFATAAREMAKVLGEDVPKAAADLSKAFTGNYDDMMKVKDVAEALDDKDRAYIKTLYDSGDASKARSEAFRIFSEKVGKAYNDGLSEMDKLQSAAAGSWSALTSAMGNTSAIQGATNAINGLLTSMTGWLRQYEAVKALSAGDLKTEQNRLYAKLTDPNAAKNYQSEANASALKTRAIFTLTGQMVAPKTAEQLRQADEARMIELGKAIHPAVTSADTTFQPVVDKPTNTGLGSGSGGTKASDPYAVSKYNPDSGSLSAPTDASTWNTAVSTWKVGKPTNDDVKAIDELKIKLPELIDPAQKVRDELAGIGHDVGQAFGSAIANGNNLGQALGNVFRNIVAQWVSSGVESIFDQMMGINANGTKATGGASSGGLLAAVLGSIKLNIGTFQGFATGTSYAPGGLAMVGERGPELVNLPRGSQVHTATDTRSMLSNIGGGSASRDSNMSVRVYVDDNGALQAAIERGANRVAMPMAVQAAQVGAMGGSALAQQTLQSQSRRQLR